MGKIYVGDGASFVWQWQAKEHIVLEGYPDGVFVRYANCDTVEAPVVQTRRDGDRLIADIPPELMMTDKDITVYVCNKDGIIHCHFLSVISSPKPSSYIYEPVEVLRYDTLAERIRLVEEWIAGGGGGPGGDLGADDIVDNLTTEASDKALSARMGFVLKNLIDLNEQRISESIRGLNADKLDASALPTAIEDALAQAKASGEFDGTDGEDGTTPHIGANGNWYIGSTDTGIEAQGPAGATGRGIKSISRTSGNGAAGTVDTYTITYTDGTKSTYQVRNGANGAKGDKGDTGATGATGATGPQGPAYKLTDADKATITAAVIEGLPKYAGEVSAV